MKICQNGNHHCHYWYNPPPHQLGRRSYLDAGTHVPAPQGLAIMKDAINDRDSIME
jgi:hypothetical protein